MITEGTNSIEKKWKNALSGWFIYVYTTSQKYLATVESFYFSF